MQLLRGTSKCSAACRPVKSARSTECKVINGRLGSIHRRGLLLGTVAGLLGTPYVSYAEPDAQTTKSAAESAAESANSIIQKIKDTVQQQPQQQPAAADSEALQPSQLTDSPAAADLPAATSPQQPAPLNTEAAPQGAQLQQQSQQQQQQPPPSSTTLNQQQQQPASPSQQQQLPQQPPAATTQRPQQPATGQPQQQPQQQAPPAGKITPESVQLTEDAAKKYLKDEEDRQRLRRRLRKGRLRELEEIRAELAMKELTLLQKEQELLEKEQTLLVLKEELDLERKLRALLTKEKERAEEEAALAMGLCTGGAMLP